ncbi:MAG: ATP-binding protein [Candidatus Omnitrophota bacterium]
MNPYSFSLLCFGFCSFFVGLLILLKRPDSIGKIYFVFTMFNSFWGIFFGIFWGLYGSYDKAIFYARLADAFSIFIPATWFHFSLVYSGKLSKFKRPLLAVYSLSALLGVFSFSSWFIPRIKPSPFSIYFTHPGPGFNIFFFLFITIIPLGFFLLVQKLKQSSAEEKNQLKGFIVATFLGFLGGGLTIPPGYDFFIPQYAVFLMPFYPFLTAYFLIRKGLFGVEELAQAAHRDKLTAIGVLAASINHEVKNPLFIIKGLAESCLERQKEGIFPNKEKALESANDAMKRSMDQADRAMDIIKRLSLFAKAGIDSEIKFEPVSIQAVLEDILPLVRYELAAHSIALTRDIPPDLPEVQVDRRYLEEILFNLIVNACQAIKESGKSGGIEITATFDTLSRPGLKKLSETGSLEGGERKVLISVADTGPGIPAEKLKDVFRPFYTTKAEGTGLGLYITKQLVEKIRGRIDAQSELGRGTIFTVTLAC